MIPTRTLNHNAASIKRMNMHPEAAKIAEAFRNSGAVGFEKLGLRTARETYQRSCLTNGFVPVDVDSIQNISVPGRNGDVPIRLYRPAGNKEVAMPAVLFIHGGGWAIGNLETHDAICRRICTETRAVVVAVDYRLSPEFPFPAGLQDCEDTLAALRKDPERFGIKPTAIAVAGDSAGGNLATVLALSDAGERPLKAMALFYPVLDLSRRSGSYEEFARGIPLSGETMGWFRDMYLRSAATAQDWRVSPALASSLSVLPPTFILTAGHDPLRDEGADFAARLAREGVEVEYRHLAGHLHGVFTAGGLLSDAEPIIGAASRHLEVWLRQ